MDHPYPDHAYLDVDGENNEKRWFSIEGMGVRYIHDDRAMEDLEAEREACAKIVEKYISADAIYPEGLVLIAAAIRDRSTPAT